MPAALRLVEPAVVTAAPAQQPPDDDADDANAPLTVPVRRGDGDVVRVPAVLLLSAAGRCSCDDCCRDYAGQRERARLSLVP